MRIEIDEVAPAKSVTFGQTLLRGLAGLILLVHGAQKLAQIGVLSAAIAARLAIADADALVLAYALAGLELAAGTGLVLGWLTRASAFVLAGSSVAAFAGEYLRLGSVLPGHAGFELASLLFAVSILLMATGAGSFSLDRALRERRRRRAIERDPVWTRPEYVTR